MIIDSKKIDKAVKSLNFTTNKYDTQREKLNCRANALVSRLENFKDKMTEEQIEAFILRLEQAAQKDNASFYEVLRLVEKEILEIVKETGIFNTSQIQVFEKCIRLAQSELTYAEHDIITDVLELNRSLLSD